MEKIFKRKAALIRVSLLLLCGTLLCGGCAAKDEKVRGIETAGDAMIASDVPVIDGIEGIKTERKTYTRGETRLIPGGDIFGVKFFTRGVIVVDTARVEGTDGTSDPARTAGIRKNDIILGINGTNVNTVEEIAGIVSSCGGSPLTVDFARGNENGVCTLTPVKSAADGQYKTGLWIRDSTAGIGTVTFVDPSDGYFAGLGHGICDADTGSLMPLRLGAVVDVTLTDIVRGAPGCPGELKGSFGTEPVGYLVDNTQTGVSGYTSKAADGRQALTVAKPDEVREGDAVILSAVGGDGVKAYHVTLSDIDRHATGTKCFGITVTDEALIALSGGIVQGMSGSPIVQDGCLIGAVTHVLVGDPTKGYGIFAENMLSFDTDDTDDTEKAAA